MHESDATIADDQLLCQDQDKIDSSDQIISDFRTTIADQASAILTLEDRLLEAQRQIDELQTENSQLRADMDYAL